MKALVFYEVIDETTMQILPFGTCTLKYAAKKDNYCIFSTQNAEEDDFDLEDYLIFMKKSIKPMDFFVFCDIIYLPNFLGGC